MSFVAPDTVFQKQRIPAFFQHNFIIICFQKSCVALAEILNHMIAGGTNIGEYADGYSPISYGKTMRLLRIVQFGKCLNRKIADLHRDISFEWHDKIMIHLQATVFMCSSSNINRYLVFPGNYFHAPRMICMFVRNKNCPYFIEGQSWTCNPFLRFATGDTGVYEHSLTVIAHIIAIPIASGI